MTGVIPYDLVAALIGIGFVCGLIVGELRTQRQIKTLRKDIGRFDHDGDGRPGGSVRRQHQPR